MPGRAASYLQSQRSGAAARSIHRSHISARPVRARFPPPYPRRLPHTTRPPLRGMPIMRARGSDAPAGHPLAVIGATGHTGEFVVAELTRRGLAGHPRGPGSDAARGAPSRRTRSSWPSRLGSRAGMEAELDAVKRWRASVFGRGARDYDRVGTPIFGGLVADSSSLPGCTRAIASLTSRPGAARYCSRPPSAPASEGG